MVSETSFLFFPLKTQPSYSAGWHTACAASIYCCMHIACAAGYLYHAVGSVRKGQDIKDGFWWKLLGHQVTHVCWCFVFSLTLTSDLHVFWYCFFGRLPVSALQENFQPLLGLLKESVQLNLSPPGHFLLLRYCLREKKAYRCIEQTCPITNSEWIDLPTALWMTLWLGHLL